MENKVDLSCELGRIREKKGEIEVEDLFELMATTAESSARISAQLAIRLKIAGCETLCPVSRPCASYEAFEKESEWLKESLERVRRQARSLFDAPSSSKGIHIAPDMTVEEIWNVLSTRTDEAALVAAFNELDVSQRQAVAEYVLTQCNIFSGKAAVFSSRYDSESGLMT